MKVATACMIFGLLAVSARAEYDVEDSVLVLTEDNFDNAISEFDHILVEFYAPWCGHCKRLAPEYASAAQKLEQDGSEIKLAKVDATAERSLAEKFEVQGFPTLKWFRGGKDTEYTGGRTEKEIVNWVMKKSGPAAKELASAEDVKAFIDTDDVVVLGAFSSADSAEAKAFMSFAAGMDDITFAVTYNGEAAAAAEMTPNAVSVFKSFDDKRANFDGDLVNGEELQTFVTGNILPLVTEFSSEMAPKIFGGEVKNHFLLFASKDANLDELLAKFRAAAEKNRGRALFIHVPPSEDRVMSYFGITEGDLPKAVFVSMPENSSMKKFMFDGELETESFANYVDSFFDGQLKPFLKSEDAEEGDLEQPVKVVRGTSFESIAFDESKDVLLEFYAPWCGHCKALAPKYEELAEKLAHNKNLYIAKMDSTANEVDHPDVNVRGFPTILYFPGGKKNGQVVEYSGGREVEDFVSFLEENANFEFSAESDDKEEL